MNRREWLAVATASAGWTACGRNKRTGFYGYGLVANAGDSSLAAIDLTTFRIVAVTGLNSPPQQIVAAPQLTSTHQAYVLSSANGIIHLIDGQFRRALSRRVADDVSEIGLTGNRHRLIALARNPNEFIELDLVTLEPLARHKLSLKADSVDFSGNYAAAANGVGSVELIDLNSGKRTRTALPALGTIRFRADGKVLLAANLQNRSLLALDVPTLQVIAELPLAMQPDHLCFNHDQGQLFVSGAGMDGVAVVFPYNTMEVDQTLLAGRDPGVMTCSAEPAYLFVGSDTGSDVCILNIDTRKVVGFVETGGRPSLIKTTPDNQYALVLDQGSGDMAVIHIPAIQASRSKTGSGLPGWARIDSPLFTMLSVGAKPVDLVVVPRVS